MRAPQTPRQEEAQSDSEEELPPATDELCAVEQEGELVLYGCGHHYAAKFKMNIFGVVVAPASEYWEGREHCGDCEAAIFEKDTRACGMCGHVIFPGDMVALYYVEPGFVKKRHAHFVYHDDGSGSIMGCSRMACCPSGGFLAGKWTRNGFVPFHESGMSAAALAFQTGKMVIGNEDGFEVSDVPK